MFVGEDAGWVQAQKWDCRFVKNKSAERFMPHEYEGEWPKQGSSDGRADISRSKGSDSYSVLTYSILFGYKPQIRACPKAKSSHGPDTRRNSS